MTEGINHMLPDGMLNKNARQVVGFQKEMADVPIKHTEHGEPEPGLRALNCSQ